MTDQLFGLSQVAQCSGEGDELVEGVSVGDHLSLFYLFRDILYTVDLVLNAVDRDADIVKRRADVAWRHASETCFCRLKVRESAFQRAVLRGQQLRRSRVR